MEGGPRIQRQQNEQTLEPSLEDGTGRVMMHVIKKEEEREKASKRKGHTKSNYDSHGRQKITSTINLGRASEAQDVKWKRIEAKT